MPDPATIYGIGMGLNALGQGAQGLWGGGDQKPDPTYSAPAIWEQGGLLKQILQGQMRGDGDFGLGAGATQANSTLTSMLGQRGYTNGVSAGGTGGGFLAQMMAKVMQDDAQNRRGFALSAATANPAVFNYQKKGTSPYGTNWDYNGVDYSNGQTQGAAAGAGQSGLARRIYNPLGQSVGG